MFSSYKYFKKIYYFLALLILITSGGTIGYIIIEGASFVDAFYMTVITISTVGFREVFELSAYGQVFTAFLIISSFGTFAYAISSLTRYVVGGEYRKYYREYRTMKESNKLNDHIIICGYGRVGKQVAEDLYSHGDSFVIIENDETIVNEEKFRTDFLFLKGDSTSDETLQLAGVKRAKAIITCLPKDADNIYVVLAARECNKSILIVSRASYPSAVSKLKIAGANNVIMPDSLGGSHMASLISNPDVMEFMDLIRVVGYDGANIESIAYDEFPGNLRGKKIGELKETNISGAMIIGFKDIDGNYLINPDDSITMEPGTRVFVIGSSDQIEKLVERFNLEH
jgi:voltage-gated potassium channel